MFKVISDNRVQEEGIPLLLHSQAVEVIREHDELKVIIIQTQSGRVTILAENAIDATGAPIS